MSEQGLDLSTYLAQLEAQRATLAIQIAGVRAAMGLPPENGTASGPTSGAVSVPLPGLSVGVGQGTMGIRSDTFFRMTIPEAVQRYLEIKKQPQAPKDIAEGLKAGGILSEAKHFYANVFTALKRLREQGLVVNTKTGGWGLSEWYAGRSGQETKPKRKGKKATGAKAAKTDAKAKKAKKADKVTAKKSPKPAGGYQAFIGEQMRDGKTMAEAAELWRGRKGAPE